MRTSIHPRLHLRRGWLGVGAAACAAAVALAACSSSTKTTTGPTSSTPGTMFSAANVTGLGMVVVDGSGHTVYVLTSGGNKNVPCDDASGCTKVWPDLPLPAGTTAATAGSGLQASLLSTMKLSDGETYPTYNGYLVYEYSGDTGQGQGHGQGIKSFGGTWYALSPAGTPVTAAPASTSGNGY
jgi:predicted lipoprotein with Yx(FWY)xxD motif